MRILNRPMFKYGGPIKEGVMHGMKESQGLQTVGSPIWPKTDGRTHQGKTGWAGKVASWFPGGAKVVGGIKTGTKDIIPRAGQYFKNLFGSTPATVKHTGKIVQPPFQLNPVGKYIVGSPEAQLAKSLYAGKGLVTKPLKWTATQAVKSPLVVGGLIWTGVNWVRKDGSPANDDEIAKAKNLAGKGEGWDPGAGADQYDPSTSASAMAAAAKKARTEKLSKYLDMMGYDRAKKTAMSDALIDASAIVQEGTEEGGSLKHADWSKMINKAIQTTSKRYDKPEQIREAVGLMMTKGAIDKDIASGKQSEAEKTMELLGITPAEYKKKFLDQKSFRENVALFSKTLQGQEAFDSAAQSTPGVDFKGNLINSTDWTKSLKAMKKDPDSVGLNEKQLIELYTEKEIAGKGYQDGDYTVGDNLVTIKDSLVIGVR